MKESKCRERIALQMPKERFSRHFGLASAAFSGDLKHCGRPEKGSYSGFHQPPQPPGVRASVGHFSFQSPRPARALSFRAANSLQIKGFKRPTAERPARRWRCALGSVLAFAHAFLEAGGVSEFAIAE